MPFITASRPVDDYRLSSDGAATRRQSTVGGKAAFGPVTSSALDQRRPSDPEFISITVWCRRVGCSRDTGYRLAKRDAIPGLFRIGTLLRVNWDSFVRSTESDQLAS